MMSKLKNSYFAQTNRWRTPKTSLLLPMSHRFSDSLRVHLLTLVVLWLIDLLTSVLDRPRGVSDEITRFAGVVGHLVTLTCHLRAYPEPDVSWSFAGATLVGSTQTDGEVTTATLDVQINSQGDYGVYTCHGNNSEGAGQVEITLSEPGTYSYEDCWSGPATVWTYTADNRLQLCTCTLWRCLCLLLCVIRQVRPARRVTVTLHMFIAVCHTAGAPGPLRHWRCICLLLCVIRQVRPARRVTASRSTSPTTRRDLTASLATTAANRWTSSSTSRVLTTTLSGWVKRHHPPSNPPPTPSLT